ncbi:unnamed protein product [Sympodiomycopsis kandeliae]
MVCSGCDCSDAQKQACAGSSSQGISLKLPLTSRQQGTSSETSPLWSTTEQSAHSNYGLTQSDAQESESTVVKHTRCEKNHSGRGGVCCRELKASDERTLINPDIVRDIIIGLSDGLTVPFALTAGLSGVGSTRLVVLAGAAELISGAVSMGVGGFLSAQAELQHYQFTKQQTKERVRRTCSSAIADEVCDILGPYGVPKEVAALVASKLQVVEQSQSQSSDELPHPATASSSSSPQQVSSQEDEQGLTPFILKLGEGLEPISSSRAWQSAITIGISYFIGGLLPLFPYIFLSDIKDALITSVIVTGIVLVVFGIVKQRWTGGAQGWGYLYGAASTLAVGGLAAGCSWLIVRSLEA